MLGIRILSVYDFDKTAFQKKGLPSPSYPVVCALKELLAPVRTTEVKTTEQIKDVSSTLIVFFSFSVLLVLWSITCRAALPAESCLLDIKVGRD